MGRRNGTVRAPQRSHLIANREARSSRACLAFTLFRPVTEETSEQLYERLHALQQEDSIPSSVHLFNRDHHSSLIQERRMRNGLLIGVASGFAVHKALRRLEIGLPGNGRECITASVTSVRAIGRNRNVVMAGITDQDKVLTRSTKAARHILGDMGLHMELDNTAHVTLGEAERGLTHSESKSVEEIASEVLLDLPIKLDPVFVELNGCRMSLSEARCRLAS